MRDVRKMSSVSKKAPTNPEMMISEPELDSKPPNFNSHSEKSSSGTQLSPEVGIESAGGVNFTNYLPKSLLTGDLKRESIDNKEF